jgi:hypothetical protein
MHCCATVAIVFFAFGATAAASRIDNKTLLLERGQGPWPVVLDPRCTGPQRYRLNGRLSLGHSCTTAGHFGVPLTIAESERSLDLA